MLIQSLQIQRQIKRSLIKIYDPREDDRKFRLIQLFLESKEHPN